MGSNSVEKYIIDPNKTNIPDEGLGEFLIGLTEEKTTFNWLHLLWNLIPIGGQFVFAMHVFNHLFAKLRPARVLIYKNGFIKQELNGSGKIKSQTVVDYNETNALSYIKTRRYTVTYGIRKYTTTDVELSILDSDNVREKILSGDYHNENETDGNYNFIGYACNAINNSWRQFAIEKFNREMASKGYATFHTPSGEVQLGKDFIKTNGVVVTSGFKYYFDEGSLYLLPNAGEGDHFRNKSDKVRIDVAQMFNKDVFLLAIDQFFGVR